MHCMKALGLSLLVGILAIGPLSALFGNLLDGITWLSIATIAWSTCTVVYLMRLYCVYHNCRLLINWQTVCLCARGTVSAAQWVEIAKIVYNGEVMVLESINMNDIRVPQDMFDSENERLACMHLLKSILASPTQEERRNVVSKFIRGFQESSIQSTGNATLRPNCPERHIVKELSLLILAIASIATIVTVVASTEESSLALIPLFPTIVAGLVYLVSCYRENR